MTTSRSLTILLILGLGLSLFFSVEKHLTAAADPAKGVAQSKSQSVKSQTAEPEKSATDAEPPAKPKDSSEKNTDKYVPLNKQGTVLLDVGGKRLILKSKVVLRQGLLELLCCLKQSKEHESILSVDTKAYIVHTGLLALKAEAGRPVAFQPEYRAPTGERIDIFLQWKDEKGKLNRVPAQTWVRSVVNRYYAEPMEKLPESVKLDKEKELRFDASEKELIWYGQMTEKQRDEWLAMSDNAEFQKAIKSMYKRSQPREMDAQWVFAGSGFFVDEKTGEKYYRAEDGDLICVANFASATLDVAVKSTAGNDELLYEAYTERIPPIGTDVTIELVPVFKKPNQDGPKASPKP